MTMSAETKTPSLLDAPLKRWIPVNLETLLIVLLLIAAVASRFYDLGFRTMSHDEINHVVPTYDLYSGRGYRYDPMSHGPLQYHMMALSYALFGDDDFTSRIPAALFGVAMVAVALFAFRRYLGRSGALVAGALLIISPFILFYARYARNEIYIVMWALLTIYAILRYLERGETWVLFLFTLVNALHFTDKATAYMFAAQQALFLGAYFVDRTARRAWPPGRGRTAFLAGLALAVVMGASAALIAIKQAPLDGAMIGLVVVLGLGSAGALVWAGVELVGGLGWETLRADRAFRMLFLLGTLMLPLMAYFPLRLLNWILGKLGGASFLLTDFVSPRTTIAVAVAAALLGAGSVALGLWWFGRKWLLHAALFFIPIILLYSTFFTAPQYLSGGFIGMLSYWSEQHGVNRGSQPIFYYALITVPMYEFLPALGTLAAAVIATVKRLWLSEPGRPFVSAASDGEQPPVPVAALLVFWSVSSLAVFSYAGERMPWLTTHIALPLVLASSWALGWMIESVPWKGLAAWSWRHYTRAVALAFFGLLALVTARSAYRAAYINQDYPVEYVVYAHAAPYPKALFHEIEELSWRTAGATEMLVGYDNHVRYPYWWYMRRYANKMDFDVNPTRDLRQALVIGVGEQNYAKLTPVVRDNYDEFNYMRLWWPNQDYFSLKWDSIAAERSSALFQEYTDSGLEMPEMTLWEYFKYAWPHVKPFFKDPAVRSAVWQIWLNRDFGEWAALRYSNAYTLTDWGVADRMRFYFRKDIGLQLWPYGAEAVSLPEPVDPYEGITMPVSPDLTLGAAGSAPGEFFSPRAVALAPDGSLYVADSLNHRIQHLSPDGQVLHAWGSFSDGGGGAPGGTFNEPWGVAVAPDGSVYVADTWNFRIQKFTADGQFVRTWDSYGSPDFPQGFYGPRGLAVDGRGRLFVADTGNKRIVIFSPEGEYLAQFGAAGMSLGQLDEPVSLAFDAFGNVYITDTWNQRVQVFAPDPSGLAFTPIAEWLVEGWYGVSLENKPFITVDAASGEVSVTDPELCRLITFSPVGQPLRVLDGCAFGAFLLPSGIASDGAGGLWVTDAESGRLVHLPAVAP